MTGAFRKDLYYRLRTHHFQLPPLRKRLEDLPLLISHFLEKAASALGKPVPSVPLALYQLLRTYSFPGNVRELAALVLDAVTRHQGRTLSLQSFKDAIAASAHLHLPRARRRPRRPRPHRCSPIPSPLWVRPKRRSSRKPCGAPRAIRAWPPGCWTSHGRP